jgi:hypothetical protein
VRCDALREHVPGFHYWKRCKQHAEKAWQSGRWLNAAGHPAMGLKRPSIINDSALELGKLETLCYLVT